ncbi:parvulin-like peptidyl-prolyl isomerase [Elusimicrobium posterum]|uniref:peptidylprolyl isomerase n=1 Tax=Elusimicrobium posterum TaxID=3116653 RepID=UPI003C751DE0
MDSALRRAETKAIAEKLAQLASPVVRIGQIYIQVLPDASADEVKAKEKLAKEVKAKVDGGMDFSAAVREYSDDKEKMVTGGDMILIKGMEGTPKNFEDMAFSLDVGKVGGPIKTPIGYHIMKVKEKKAAEEVTYEKVAPDFMRYLQEVHKQQYLKEQYEMAEIKINKDFSELDALIEAQRNAAMAEAKKTEDSKKTTGAKDTAAKDAKKDTKATDAKKDVASKDAKKADTKASKEESKEVKDVAEAEAA